MVRDRIAEYRKKAKPDGNNGDISLGGSGASFSNGTVVIEIQRVDNDLDHFFNQVRALKKLIEDVKTKTEKVNALYHKILLSAVPPEGQKAELDDLMSAIKSSSHTIRGKLKEMEMSNNMQTGNEKSDSAEARIRITQHSALLQNFIDVINQYQLAQSEYRNRCQARIKRQSQIMGLKYTEEEVEEMIGDGDFTVFTHIILELEEAREVHHDVDLRQEEMLKLEESITELHDLFVEMANFVNDQGAKVDSIATHVQSTQNYVEKGKEHLEQARDFRKKSRKRLLWILTTLISIAVVVAIIVYFC